MKRIELTASEIRESVCGFVLITLAVWKVVELVIKAIEHLEIHWK